MATRTHKGYLVCCECFTEIKLPSGSKWVSWEHLNDLCSKFDEEHKDCVRVEEGYISNSGVRIVDRRYLNGS